MIAYAEGAIVYISLDCEEVCGSCNLLSTSGRESYVEICIGTGTGLHQHVVERSPEIKHGRLGLHCWRGRIVCTPCFIRTSRFLWSPYVIGQTIYIFFILSFVFFFFLSFFLA